MQRIGRHLLVVAAAATLACVGCSSSDSTDTGSNTKTDAGSTPSGTDAGTPATDSGTGGQDASSSEDAAPPSGPCTEQGSVCAEFNLPSSMSGPPQRLIVGFYKALPPAGPPDKLGAQENGPAATPGKPFDLKMTGMDMKGDYYMYAAFFMPGGGQFQPKAGVDYVGQTDKPITFDGSPVTIPAIDLKLAQ